MRVSPIAIIRHLGLRRFLQLVTHLPSFLKLFTRLAKDPRVPLTPKLILAGVLAYLIFPADLFPDFLLGLGELDDMVVIFLGLKLFLRLCPQEVVHEQVHSIASGR